MGSGCPRRWQWVCPRRPACTIGSGRGAGAAGLGERGGDAVGEGGREGAARQRREPPPNDSTRFPTALDSAAVHSVSAAPSARCDARGARVCLPRKFPLSLSHRPIFSSHLRFKRHKVDPRSALFPCENSERFSLALWNNPTPIAVSLCLPLRPIPRCRSREQSLSPDPTTSGGFCSKIPVKRGDKEICPPRCFSDAVHTSTSTGWVGELPSSDFLNGKGFLGLFLNAESIGACLELHKEPNHLGLVLFDFTLPRKSNLC